MTKKQIHEEAILNFDKIQEAVKEVRDQALQDRRFYSIEGAQWEGYLGEQFENKPKFEVNKVHLAVIKIINEYRNNRVSVNFISKDGSVTDETADTCDGLFRADESDSCAEEAYDNAFEEAVGGGYGALRVISEYEDEEDEDNEQQRIRIEPIYDADSSVFFDLDAKRQDKSDAKYCFVLYSITQELFEEIYDKAATSMDKYISDAEYDWFGPNVVHIAEYYRIEQKTKEIRTFVNLTGDEIKYSEDDFEDDLDLERRLEATGSKELRRRKIKVKKVHKYIISGNEILEDCGYIAGKHIPIIPVYGKRWFVDGNERFMGHVRLVKDAQRLKNMLTSKLAEISSLSTVEKPIFTPEQMVGHAEMWSKDNITNFPYLLVNPVEDANGNMTPAGPVGYTKPPQIPPALAALLQIVDVDINELLGRTADAEKMLSHVSGKAHELIQKRIDGQAFIYMSNFSKAIKRVGEIWLSMAKEVYVEKGRKMKTVDRMGQLSSVELLKEGLNSSGGPIDKNDLSKASFDVKVDVGPSSSSQRDATVQTVTSMLAITQDPEISQILQSLAMMNMEGDGISDVRSFFRKRLVTMGVVKPTKEEVKEMEEAAKNAKPDPNERVLNAMADEAESKAAKTRVEVLKVLADIGLIKAETFEKYSDVDIKKAETVEKIVNNSPNQE